MVDPMMQHVLARLAVQDRRVAALERRRARGRRLPALLVALLAALTPLAILAATPFSDLTGGVHDQNIDAIYNAGVTKGCVPNQEYCPTANVTREEMASFLARLGGLGDNPPVANALTAQTAVNAAIADNADTLGGKRADGLIRVARGTSGLDMFAEPSTSFGVPLTATYPNFAALPGAAVTIKAPADGYVLVTAVVGVLHAPNELPSIRLRDASPGAPATAISRVVFTGISVVTSNNQLVLTWVFPVTGAGAKTFILEIAQFNNTAEDVSFFNDALTALYVPFGYDGGTSLGP